ncbi:MAG: flagellar hook basal-body protein [Acidobacteriaceae bacterium]
MALKSAAEVQVKCGMDSGYYAAVTALVGRMQALDLTANNLANANTAGFRAQREHFQSVLTEAGDGASSLSQAVNQYGMLSGSDVDLSQGELQKTGGDLDLAVEGSGFFAVQTAQGLRYTRNGAFHADKSGMLVDAAGSQVEGQTGAIRMPAGPVSIGEDGTVAVNDAVVGKLKLLQPKQPGALVPAAGSQFTANPADMKPVTDVHIRQGALESANVTPVDGAIALVNLQRQAEMMQRVLSIFHSDFNNTAIQDVAKG